MATFVSVDGRTFVVSFDGDGEARMIKERKMYAPGEPWAALYNAPYWHRDHHKSKGPQTLVSRVIAAAKEKRAS